MNSFKELDKAIKAVYEAMDNCDAAKPVYIKKQSDSLDILVQLEQGLKSCLQENKRADGDNPEVLKTKTEHIGEFLKNAHKKLQQAAKIKAEMKHFTDRLLENDFTNATEIFYKYRQFRESKKQEYVDTKVNIAVDMTKLQKHLVSKKASSKSISAIDTFLSDLKSLNLYETTAEDVQRLMTEFGKATKHGLFSTGRAEKKGMETQYEKPLQEVLDSAERYTTLSGKYWKRCHELRDKLKEGGGYIKAIRKEVNADQFERDFSKKYGDIEEGIKRLEQRIERYLPEEESAQLLKEVSAPSGFEKLKEFAKIYNLGNLKTIDFENMDMEQPEIAAEIPFKSIETPKCEASVPIPGYEIGVVTIGIEIGASVKASAGLGGNVKLTPFDDTLLTSSINAKGELKAEVFLGAFVEFVKIVKITGKGVLGAGLSIELAVEHKLEKALLRSFDHFALEGKSEIKLEIEGHLELVVGLTAPVKIILEACQIKPELTFKTKSLTILEASRSDTLNLDIPINREPDGFPRKTLELKKGGEWKVDFIAKEKIADIIRRKFGGLDKFNEAMEQQPLTEGELEQIKEEYSFIGSRSH
jgi:hypothetical protein